MKDILINILETFCPDNVYLQGTLNPDEAYPAKFITFFTTDSDFEAYYDDDPNRIAWYVTVIFYSNNPQEVLTVPREIIAALRAAGFLPQNAGIDVISDVETHTGWAMDFIYPEQIS